MLETVLHWGYGFSSGLPQRAVVILLLVLVFASGALDAILLKRKDLACITWFPGLAAIAVWIAYPFTAYRIVAAALAFVLGLTPIVVCYRHPGRRANR